MNHISGRQATILFFFYYTGTAVLVLPTSLITIAKQDAWLSVIIGMLLHFLILLLLFQVSKRIEKQSISNYLQAKLGRVIGKLLLATFITLFPFLNFLIGLYLLGTFITTSLMPATPTSAIYALMLIAIVYILHCGFSVVGRSAELLFLIVPSIYVLLMISLLPSSNWGYIFPVLEYGIQPVMSATFPLLGYPYLDTILFMFLLPYMNNINLWKNAIVKASLLSGVAILLTTLFLTAVLSPAVVSNLNFASYFAVRTISISDFYERFEGLFTIVFYIVLFFKLSILLFISAQGMRDVFSMKSYKSLLIPLALIGLALADAISPSTTYIFHFFRTSWIYYTVVFGLLFPLLLWVLHYRKTKSRL